MRSCVLTPRPTRTSHAALVVALALLAPSGVGQAIAGDAGDKNLARAVDIVWRDVPLREAVDRLGAVADTRVWLDRRVDPTQPLDLNASGVSVLGALQRLAEANGLSVVTVEGVAYVGPLHGVAQLSRTRSLAAANPALRRRLKRSTTVRWPRLATPRDVVQQAASDARVRITSLDRIPHDLLPAGALPARPLGDQLSLLLVGFGLEWRVDPEQPLTLSLAPYEPRASNRGVSERRSDAETPRPQPSDLRFTLRVRDQPLSAVLEQVAQRAGVALDASRVAPRGAARRVTFSVENATLRALVAEAAGAAGLRGRLEDGRIVLEPATP
ncbi:MAG: hypothetical protein AAFV43_00715 [Planctomycetota bacterium]